MAIKRAGGGKLPHLSEVLFEFQRVGNIMRVVAIDPKTGVEVIMVADPKASQETIKQMAARKLAYVLQKKMAKGEVTPKKRKGFEPWM